MFGKGKKLRFDRPCDGKVNGYIKFNWPNRQSSAQVSSTFVSPIAMESAVSTRDTKMPSTSLASSVSIPGATSASITIPSEFDPRSFDFLSFLNNANPSETFCPALSLANADALTNMVPVGAPRMVPKLFGYEADMDQTDRKLWTFCAYPRHVLFAL